MIEDLDKLYTLMLDTNNRVKEMNGAIDRHNEEIFGSSNSPGLRREMDEIHDFMIGTKSAAKTLIALISVIGIANLIALLVMITSINGGT